VDRVVAHDHRVGDRHDLVDRESRRARHPGELARRCEGGQDRQMRRAILTIAGVGAALGVSAPAPAQEPGPGHTSCAEFGGNVAFLATSLGPVFGATASGVASSAPGAFPTLVVGPEQAGLCESSS
jgi:hypothetical protein